MTTLVPVPDFALTPLPVVATPRTAVETFVAPTAWGSALIGVRGEDVVNVDPPTRGPKARGGEALFAAPLVVRELAERIAAMVDGVPLEAADPEQLERWLIAAGMSDARRRMQLALARSVPWGMTVTYGELAELAGFPRAARAAGSACARNPLPLVVPCHRVLPASGGIGNFGFHGAEYKRRLLELEGVRLP